jgi:hypothetical protein
VFEMTALEVPRRYSSFSNCGLEMIHDGIRLALNKQMSGATLSPYFGFSSPSQRRMQCNLLEEEMAKRGMRFIKIQFVEEQEPS